MSQLATKKRTVPSRVVDWAVIRARLERAVQCLESAVEPSPERVTEILQQRADELARRSDAGQGAVSEMRSVLVFAVAGERYGVDAQHASEVLRLEALTPIPRAAPLVAGVTNRRGQLVLLVDLYQAIGVTRVGVADMTRVVIVGPAGRELGLLVESVEGITELPARATTPSLRGGSFVEGIAGGDLVLLDVPALLSDPRLAARSRART
jgi:purine-binding chemotaxis protein CheW